MRSAHRVAGERDQQDREVVQRPGHLSLTSPLDPRERQCLEAIVAAPADDAPRLIYADWLMERGDPRGEHIALMVEAARLETWDPRRSELETKARALGIGKRSLAKKYGVDVMGSERGLVSAVKGTMEQLWAARELFELQPIHEVYVDDLERSIDRLVDFEPLRRVRSLVSFQTAVSMSSLAKLLASPHAAALTALRIDSLFGRDERLAAAAAGHTRFAELRGRTLDLPALAEAGLLQRLVEVSAVLTDDDVRAIAAHGRALRRVEMFYGQITSRQLEVLVAAPALSLRSFSRALLDTRGAELLARVPWPLEDLRFDAGGPIDPLLSSDRLAKLVTLGADNAYNFPEPLLDARFFAALGPGLRSLIHTARAGGRAALVADSPAAAGLVHLMLGERLDDDAAALIANPDRFPNLRRVDLNLGDLSRGQPGADALVARFGDQVRIKRRKSVS